MPDTSFEANGRLTIDENHERYYLFVPASGHVTHDGHTVSAASLPATDPQFITEVLEGFAQDGRGLPAGSSFEPAVFPSFRIIRLIDEDFDVVPADIEQKLHGPGDTSRAVTICGHIATDEETGSHDRLTDPTVVVEKVVTFESIQQRAFGIFESGENQSAIDNWLAAERELLQR
jgi:hypothetical protein